MRSIPLPALGLTVVLALAGCLEDTGTGSTSSSNPMFPNVGMSPDVSQAAVDACRRAVDAQTDGAVEVVGSEFSQAASAVWCITEIAAANTAPAIIRPHSQSAAY